MDKEYYYFTRKLLEELAHDTMFLDNGKRLKPLPPVLMDKLHGSIIDPPSVVTVFIHYLKHELDNNPYIVKGKPRKVYIENGEE